MCQGDPQTLCDEPTKSITCRTDPGANTASEEEGRKVLPLSRGEQSDGGIPVAQMDCAFLHNTGDEDAKVTFLMMVDRINGCDGSPEEATRQVC